MDPSVPLSEENGRGQSKIERENDYTNERGKGFLCWMDDDGGFLNISTPLEWYSEMLQDPSSSSLSGTSVCVMNTTHLNRSFVGVSIHST